MNTSTTLIDPPQPSGQGEYSVTMLTPSTIKTFSSQADYKLKTGSDAPAYNPAFPIKRWLDTAAAGDPGGMLTYNVIHVDNSGKVAESTIMLPAFLVGQVNLTPDSGPIPASSLKPYLIPVRALLPNEQPQPNAFGPEGYGGVGTICNTDIYNPHPPQTPGGAGGGFTDTDRAALTSTQTMVNKIAAAMGLS
jgi:hypothetical protein